MITDDGRHWNVSPTLLNKVEENDVVEVVPDNVIELKAKKESA